MGVFLYGIFDVLYAYCCILLFRFFAEKRSRANRFIIFLAAILLGSMGFIIGQIFYTRFYIKAFLVVGVTAIIMLLLFRISCAKALTLSAFCYGAQLTAEYVVIVVMGKMVWLIAGKPFDLYDVVTFTAVCIVNKVMLLGVVLWIGKQLGRKGRNAMTKKEWCSLFIISFITICLIAVIVSETDVLSSENPDSSFIYIAVGILVINYIICYLVQSVMKREAELREYALFSEKVKSETAMYRSISENLEKQRKRTHEYKNQIAAISALLSDGKYQELKTYLEKIDSEIQLRMDAIDTNNVIVNAILNTKYREAVNSGIVFVLKVNDLSKLKIEETDIVVILSNLLNNAIEACEKCKDKIVKFKFVLEDGQTVISVKNSMVSEPLVKDGRFLTTKTDEIEEHGMGIRNVVETVEKYGGRYMIDYDKGMFEITILIPSAD